MICLSLALNESDSKVKVLYLGGIEMTEAGLEYFLDSFKFNKSLRSLTLNDIIMNNKMVDTVGSFLTKNAVLEDINLSGCKITDETLMPLKNSLALNTNLKSLNLGRNDITDEGAWEISKLLQEYNETLHYINLDGNEIDESIVEEIQDFLKQNRIFQREAIKKVSVALDKSKKDEEEDEKADEEEMELYESMLEEQRVQLTEELKFLQKKTT